MSGIAGMHIMIALNFGMKILCTGCAPYPLFAKQA